MTNKKGKASEWSRLRLQMSLWLDVDEVRPHQSIDVFRLVYEHSDLLRVSAEDRLDQRRLGRREDRNTEQTFVST